MDAGDFHMCFLSSSKFHNVNTFKAAPLTVTVLALPKGDEVKKWSCQNLVVSFGSS